VLITCLALARVLLIVPVGRLGHTGTLQHVELRRRVQAGLNKSEARNALARAVFFNASARSATATSTSSATGPAA
jgi:Tn3 transposase DDE domain